MPEGVLLTTVAFTNAFKSLLLIIFCEAFITDSVSGISET